MLAATLLALVAAVLHTAWNLVAKTSGDRFVALWGQFVVGGAVGAAGLTAIGGWGSVAWRWALLSGLVHVPYAWLLARAYRLGDFSLAYPVARGGGALGAAVLGALTLGDELPPAAWVALAVVAGGIAALARPAGSARGLWAGLAVAATIAVYTVVDTTGARASRSLGYGLAVFVAASLALSVVGLGAGRGHALVAAFRVDGVKLVLAGIASALAYSLVLVAVRSAPVGYVATLRETSVVLSALAGWRLLGERLGRNRLASSAVVVVGLIGLVVAR